MRAVSENSLSILKSVAVALVLLTVSLPRPTVGGELLRYSDSAPLPDFVLPDLAGTQHRLTDYRGQVVLVNFWASWCPPCLAEMPSMQRVSETMRGRPFRILAINVDVTKATVWKFRKLLDIDFTTLLDSNAEITMAWKVEVFPSSYVIDSEGRAQYVAYGALEWDDAGVVNVIETLMPDRGSDTRAATD